MSTIELEPATELLTLEQCLVKHERPKPTIDQNGNPILYTGPAYTFDPKRKASPSSYLRIKSDGTVSYNNPNCLKYAAPGSRPFHLPALKPRTETSAVTFERLKAGIEKRASKLRNSNCEKYVGNPCLDTWEIVCTDQHTMLLKRGPGTGERNSIYDLWQQKARLVCSIDNPEFHLALKRALIMTGENDSKVRLMARPGMLEISSSHEEPRGQRSNNDAGSFAEQLDVNTCES